MSGTPDKCPKCGAEATPERDKAVHSRDEWECGTYRLHSTVVGLEESRDCLRRQLSQVTAQRDRLATVCRSMLCILAAKACVTMVEYIDDTKIGREARAALETSP